MISPASWILTATLSFSAGAVCSSFSAEASAILQTLCWFWQHQQVYHFSSLPFLSDSRSVLSFVFPFTSISRAETAFSLSSCTTRLQWIHGHSFLQVNKADDELVRWGALLVPSAISLLLSFLTTLLFSQTEGILSHQNSSTHRFPGFPLRNLCFLVMLTVCSLVFAAMDTAFC